MLRRCTRDDSSNSENNKIHRANIARDWKTIRNVSRCKNLLTVILAQVRKSQKGGEIALFNFTHFRQLGNRIDIDSAEKIPDPGSRYVRIIETVIIALLFHFIQALQVEAEFISK